MYSVGKILENMTAKSTDPKPPALIKPEVVTELTPLQEEVSFRTTEIEELAIETLVDLPAEPTVTGMRASLSLRSPDEYDLLQIYLQEIDSQGIKLLIV